jgi:hypothetical protein
MSSDILRNRSRAFVFERILAYSNDENDRGRPQLFVFMDRTSFATHAPIKLLIRNSAELK